MKKALSYILIVIMVLSLVCCEDITYGGTDTGETQKADSSGTADNTSDTAPAQSGQSGISSGKADNESDKEGEDAEKPPEITPTEYSPYEVLIYSARADYDENTHCTEGVYKDYDFFYNDMLEAAPKTLSVSIGGTSQLGNYQSSDRLLLSNIVVHQYKTSSGVTFSVDTDTQEITQFDLKPQSNPIVAGNKTAEECRVIADELIAQYADPSEFVVTYEIRSLSDGSSCDHFRFSYEKYWRGIQTYERASVSVSTSGQVFSFYSVGLGDIDPDADLGIDMLRADTNINEYFESIKEELLSKVKKAVNVEPEITKTVAMTFEGKFCLIYLMGYKFTMDRGNGQYSELHTGSDGLIVLP